MNTNELFIDIEQLPKQLTKQETKELLEKIKQGDNSAKEKLIVHSIRLVLYEVTNRFKEVQYDKKELVSIGNIGLIKAVQTFDITKKIEFSTYAIRCIDNEIITFLRKLKKIQNIDSLDKTSLSKCGDEFKIFDLISSKTDIEKEYIDIETKQIVKKIISDLPKLDKRIIMLRFGFYDGKAYTLSEIAQILSVSKSHVKYLTAKILKKIRHQLQQNGIIEFKPNKPPKITEETKKNKIY